MDKTAQYIKDLARFVRADDMLETNTGVYRAVSGVTIRIGTSYFEGFAQVEGKRCYLPVQASNIKAVWRAGVCLWERDKQLRQMSLFDKLGKD